MKELLTKLLDPMKDVREQYEAQKAKQQRFVTKTKLLTKSKKVQYNRKEV